MDSKNRVLENEDELIRNLCIHYGFTAITLGALPFHLQVLLIRDAEIVVAPHGAGLVNLVFRGKRTRMICELQPETYRNTCFAVIAEALGDSYCSIPLRDVEVGGHQHQLRSRLTNEGWSRLMDLLS